jgi:hypothetical protein
MQPAAYSCTNASAKGKSTTQHHRFHSSHRCQRRRSQRQLVSSAKERHSYRGKIGTDEPRIALKRLDFGNMFRIRSRYGATEPLPRTPASSDR